LAFALILGACPADSGTPSEHPTLKLSGQVYIQDINFSLEALRSNSISSISTYNDSLKISDGGMGGKGEINNGQLSYTIIGVPSPINEGGDLDYLKEMYSSLTFSSEDVNVAAVALKITDSDEYNGLLKGLLDINSDIKYLQLTVNITINTKTVTYVYVDKDLNITADADTFEYNGFDFPISLTTEKIDLSLKNGWNSLCSEITAQMNVPLALLPALTSPNPDLSSLKPTGKLKMSVSDPAEFNWTLVSSQSSVF